MTRFVSSAFAALGFFLFAQGSGYSAEKITLIHSVPQLTSLFSFGSSIPIDLGFWKEEGLEVEALPAPGAAAAIQLVVGGRATAAIANPSSRNDRRTKRQHGQIFLFRSKRRHLRDRSATRRWFE